MDPRALPRYYRGYDVEAFMFQRARTPRPHSSCVVARFLFCRLHERGNIDKLLSVIAVDGELESSNEQVVELNGSMGSFSKAEIAALLRAPMLVAGWSFGTIESFGRLSHEPFQVTYWPTPSKWA